MQTSMKLLLTAPPDQCRAALRFGLPVAHVAYRVGGGPHLFRASIPVSVRGGLMVIDNTGFDGRGEAGPFCQEVLRECMARGYDGILCDFEGHPLQVLAQAVRTLGELTKKRGWPLYVTEAYAPFSDFAIALIPSALSGGSLQQRLQEAVERFGAARVALAVERVAEDFFLPSPPRTGSISIYEAGAVWLRNRQKNFPEAWPRGRKGAQCKSGRAASRPSTSSWEVWKQVTKRTTVRLPS